METYRMGRLGQRKRGSSCTPEDMVIMCKEYSRRLQVCFLFADIVSSVGCLPVLKKDSASVRYGYKFNSELHKQLWSSEL